MTSSNSRAGIIFDIQRFSLHDGPGIRTAVFFKGCPLRCGWCQNPESFKLKPEVAFYAERCQACFLCESLCPLDAISREPARRVRFSQCDGCGECASVCPNQAIRLIGQAWSVPDLVQELLKDTDFYEDSGGGVTLTGGEPMVQSAFLAQLLPQLQAAGVHVNLETCGMFKWDQIVALLPYLDLIYFDLKHLNPESHEALTGRDNQMILENFGKLAAEFPHLQARMPLIPSLNDELDNIAATACFLTDHGQRTIHCLPYHNLGEAKLPRIDTPLRTLALKRLTAEDLETVKNAFEQGGVHAIIYD